MFLAVIWCLEGIVLSVNSYGVGFGCHFEGKISCLVEHVKK